MLEKSRNSLIEYYSEQFVNKLSSKIYYKKKLINNSYLHFAIRKL